MTRLWVICFTVLCLRHSTSIAAESPAEATDPKANVPSFLEQTHTPQQQLLQALPQVSQQLTPPQTADHASARHDDKTSKNITGGSTDSINNNINSIANNTPQKINANINTKTNNPDQNNLNSNTDNIITNKKIIYSENTDNSNVNITANIINIGDDKKDQSNINLNTKLNNINTDLNNNVNSNTNINSVDKGISSAKSKLNSHSNCVINGPSSQVSDANGLNLHIGNYSIAACCLSHSSYTELLLYYPQHCLADDGLSKNKEDPNAVGADKQGNKDQGEETGQGDNVVKKKGADDGAVVGNSTGTCGESEDLPAVGAAEKEHLSSLSIFLILCVLALCVLLIFCLLKTKLQILPESVACVLVGALIGLVLKILSSENIANWQREEAFSPTVFFLVILPPIIFESGYNLNKGNFFQNIGSILVFAIIGTLLSAIVVGGGIYLLGQADVVYKLSWVESFAFGSLISAVDPVATLALFHALKVEPVLYMLVFGESVLNDAVSILLTSSILEMAKLGEEISAWEAVVQLSWRFTVMFLGSAGIGVAFALLSALILKHVALRDYTSLELCVLIIFIYAPYALAEGIHLSGIMAILFSGVVMSHYTHYNLSPVLQITVQHLMRTLAFAAECIVFIYLGMALFSFKHQFHGALVGWSIVLCLLGRALNIFPLSFLVNRFRDHRITPKMMFVMWFSGLRGAIAYALALHLEFSDEKRHVLVTTTLFIVLFTIFILGGSVVPLIKHLDVEKPQRSKRKPRKEKTPTLSKTREWGQAVDSEHLSEVTEEESSEAPSRSYIANGGGSGQLHGFLKLDTKYLRPFFCRSLTHQEVRGHAMDLKRQCYQSLNVQPSDSEDSEDMFALT